MMLKDLREQIAFYGRQLMISDLSVGTAGNISVRDFKSGLMAITPSAIPYSILRAEDIVVMDIGGFAVDNKARPSTEWKMHRAIYHAFPKISAIIHTHSTYATACAATGGNLPLVTTGICKHCTKSLQTLPFNPPSSDGGAQAICDCLAEGNFIALLQNHGTVSVGVNLWYAFDAACAVEHTAKVVANSAAFGVPMSVPAEARAELYKKNPLTHSVK